MVGRGPTSEGRGGAGGFTKKVNAEAMELDEGETPVSMPTSAVGPQHPRRRSRSPEIGWRDRASRSSSDKARLENSRERIYLNYRRQSPVHRTFSSGYSDH
jgi:hypothetical protein